MHMMLQTGGRSSKQANGPSSTTQLKRVDSSQNSGSSLNSQVRGKRERSDNGSPVKQELSLKSDDADSLQCKIESTLKFEIAQITEKGGVVELEGIDKLIQLMKPVKTEIKWDLSSRSMLAGVMAATDKIDCLNRFVQLKGLSVLDEWLQDIPKGRIGDGSKDSDKSVDEFVLVLLQALDKLPVNLHALKMCNIGKSVNNLRSHKNSEIQKKARSLVGTWKKRVEVEMNDIDQKTGSNQGVSWPSKSRIPEASHSGMKTPRGTDVSMRNLTQNSTSSSSRSSHGDANIISEASPTGTGEQVSPSVGQENHPKNSAGITPDVAQIKEERSNRASQSQKYSPSNSLKDDARSTSSGSATARNMSSSGSQSKKGISYAGMSSQKESSRSSSSQKVAALEKKSHSALSGERVMEGAVSEGKNHKLIVKIPNRVNSPAQVGGTSVVGGPLYISRRVSSPLHSDKHELFDNEDRIEPHRFNVSSDKVLDSRQDGVSKDVPSGSTDGDGPHDAFPDGGHIMATDDLRRRVDGSLPTSQHRPVELHSLSFSPMNALVESCAKYSGVSTSPSLEDNGGINLLASVAAAEEVCVVDVGKSKLSPEDLPVGDESQTCNDAESDDKKQYVVTGGLQSEDSSHLPKHGHMDTDRRSHGSEEVPLEINKFYEISSRDRSNTADMKKLESTERLNKIAGIDSVSAPSAEKPREIEPNKKMLEENATFGNANFNSGRFDDMEAKEKVNSYYGNADEVKPTVEVAAPSISCEGDCKNNSDERRNKVPLLREESSSVGMHGLAKGLSNEKPFQTVYDPKQLAGLNTRKTDVKDGRSHVINSGLNFDVEEGTVVSDESRQDAASSDKENKVTTRHTLTAAAEGQRLANADHEATGQKTDLSGAQSASVPSDVEGDYASSGNSDGEGKMKFDLNEGLDDDEERLEEPISLTTAGAKGVQMINTLTHSLNPVPQIHSSSITVASAAKGSFVPPDDLLRSKMEIGWKGAAATSAFRPAEPRRAPEMTLGSSTTISCSDASTSNKSGRFPLDIDLNVPDEGLVEEMTSRDYAMDFDLNAVEEANDNGNGVDLVNAKHKGGGLASADARRGFDLNDGPVVYETNAKTFSINHQMAGGGMPTPHLSGPSPPGGLRMNGSGLESFSPWFPTGNNMFTTVIPSMLPNQGDHPFPFFQATTAQRPLASSVTDPFNPEAYRGSAFSPSPAINFPAGPFPFPFLPFGTSFPVPSTSTSIGATSYGGEHSSAPSPRLFAPPLHQQLLGGSVNALPSQFPRPYVSSSNGNSLLDNSNNRTWGRQGLDLNAGPSGGGVTEAEPNREEMVSLTFGQQFIGGSRALTEEHARNYFASVDNLKRKEPEGGLDKESFRPHKQPWQ